MLDICIFKDHCLKTLLKKLPKEDKAIILLGDFCLLKF